MKKRVILRVVSGGETVKKLMGYLQDGYRIIEVRVCDGGVCNVLEKEVPVVLKKKTKEYKGGGCVKVQEFNECL